MIQNENVREALIDVYNRCFDTTDDVDVLAEYISELEARIPQWISVKDRLPENSNIVLVCVDNIVPEGYVQIGWMLGEFFENKHVTHWMPLPEPPEDTDADN